MIFKSYLMVAGDKEKHLSKINDLKCDVAMINLEDGVGDKEYALNLLRQTFALNGMRTNNKYIVVRINPLDETGLEEIKILNILKPHAIRIPKIKSVNEVKKALKAIDQEIDIHLSIETKEGFENLKSFKIDKRVTTVYLGILDLLESLVLPQNLLTLNNPTIHYILSKFLIESKMAGFNPIFFTYQDYKNTNEFKSWLDLAKNMGFEATSCISPSQVDIANKVFEIDSDEYEKAKYIVELFEANLQNKISGFSDEKYGFIDEPIYKNAKNIIKKR
ncbi:MAG: HpcH/HpaI aldolase/citrate lyase family protein [Arcobacteraceae bacterium]